MIMQRATCYMLYVIWQLPTHLSPGFVRGNDLFDEPKLRGRDSTNQEEEEQRVVAGMWTTHLELRDRTLQLVRVFFFKPPEVLIPFPTVEQSVMQHNTSIISSLSVSMLSHCSAGHV